MIEKRKKKKKEKTAQYLGKFENHHDLFLFKNLHLINHENINHKIVPQIWDVPVVLHCLLHKMRHINILGDANFCAQ